MDHRPSFQIVGKLSRLAPKRQTNIELDRWFNAECQCDLQDLISNTNGVAIGVGCLSAAI
jgi:hypothetical protein